MTRTEVVPRGSTSTPAPRARRPRRRGARSGLFEGLVFLAPFLLVYAAFVFCPVGQALQMSLYDWNMLGYVWEPVRRGS